MKIGVSSYSFGKHLIVTKCSYLDICDKAKEMGFDAIEFIDLEHYSSAMLGTEEETALKIKEHCEKIGLEISDYAVTADLLNVEEEVAVNKVLRRIDIASILGVKLLRHDICHALPKSYLYTYRDAIKVVAPRIRKITEYAAKMGIKTCSENHGRVFQAPERVEELILAVGSDNYGWLCDMGNFLGVDADPVKSVTIAAPYTFHVHAKDFLYKTGEGERPEGFGVTEGGNFIRGTVLGHGVVPIKQCINILKNKGYDGSIIIEFEGKEECIPSLDAGLKFLKAVM